MSKPVHADVISQVVARDFCCGCGVCAGVCPRRRLEMRFNRYGEYIPYAALDTACPSGCDLCLKVCPFTDEGDNEDALARELYAVSDALHDPVLGYYRRTIVGWRKDQQRRIASASGGLATWYLETLLARAEVDAVACVFPCDDGVAFYRYGITSVPGEVVRSARSCYYPVELSGVVRHMLGNGARYAVVGLPCHIKALRRAVRVVPALRSRITHTAGLVCGQMKSALFARYICMLAGGDPQKMRAMQFRIKDPTRPASDYGYRIECEGKLPREIYWTQGINRAWCDGYFKLNACDYCDDVFAETADVAFMDAWARPWVDDWRGTSFVVLRTHGACDVFSEGAATADIHMEDVPAATVCASQSGVVKHKRHLLAERLGVMRRRRILVHKRVAPVRISVLRRMHVFLERWPIRSSRSLFLLVMSSGSLAAFKGVMLVWLLVLKTYAYLGMLTRKIRGLILGNDA